MTEPFERCYLDTPIGRLAIAANDHGVTEVLFCPADSDSAADDPQALSNNPILAAATQQLSEYFAGSRKVFTVPLSPSGTDFRQQVWRQLQTIGYGQTQCYGDIANAIANQKAVRAVGSANGANPIAIIIPCHRVIGKNGSLTGYAGGLDRKQWLLAFEQNH